MSRMAPTDVLQRLVSIFPAFGAYWQSDDTFKAGDAAFTYCGVFASFTHWFRESFDQLPAASLRALGEFVGECMKEPNSDIHTAAAACFLENVTGEPLSPKFKAFLSGNALRFFEQFDPPKGKNRGKKSRPA
jgi:hypothetical protein